MRRSLGRTVLAVVFAVFALNAWSQVVLVALGRSDDPPALTALQTGVGLTGVFAAWGSWTGARWAPVAAVLYGATTASMLVSLPPLLQLESEARSGISAGALSVLLFSLLSAWYLRRVLRRADRT